MPRQIIVKRRFDIAYARLSKSDKPIVAAALHSFGRYLETGHAAPGLGVTRLGSQTYEFRAGLAMRVVYISQQDKIVLSLLGSHDEVRRFLKNQ